MHFFCHSGVTKCLWHFLTAGAITLVLCNSNPAFADACADKDNTAIIDGKCWRTLRPVEKISIVQGIWVGEKVKSAALDMSAQDSDVAFGVDWTSLPPDTSIGDIVSYFDKLYESPANRRISWSNAYLLAALAARDDDENDRLSLLTFFRSNDYLPTYGSIVEFVSPTVVKVLSNEKIFEVHLSGVRVPPAVEVKALDFLHGLEKGSFKFEKDCSKVEPMPVTLYYGSDIFDREGQLTARIRISEFYQPCVGNSLIKLTDTGYVDVGYFLVNHGLAECDTVVDPKWSDKRKQLLCKPEYMAQNAKKEQIYLYGQNTDPLIETISGQ